MQATLVLWGIVTARQNWATWGTRQSNDRTRSSWRAPHSGLLTRPDPWSWRTRPSPRHGCTWTCPRPHTRTAVTLFLRQPVMKVISRYTVLEATRHKTVMVCKQQDALENPSQNSHSTPSGCISDNDNDWNVRSDGPIFVWSLSSALSRGKSHCIGLLIYSQRLKIHRRPPPPHKKRWKRVTQNFMVAVDKMTKPMLSMVIWTQYTITCGK